MSWRYRWWDGGVKQQDSTVGDESVVEDVIECTIERLIDGAEPYRISGSETHIELEFGDLVVRYERLE